MCMRMLKAVWQIVVRVFRLPHDNSPDGVLRHGKAAPVLRYSRQPLSPVSDFLLYFIERSKINPAINQPAPFPLGDKVCQAMNCPYLHYCKLSSILPHLHCNKGMYILLEA